MLNSLERFNECPKLKALLYLVDRVVQLFDELSTSGDFVFARVKSEAVAKFVFSDEADFVDLGDSHRLALAFRGTTVEDRILEDDFVSYFVGCFLMRGRFDQFHLVVFFVAYMVIIPQNSSKVHNFFQKSEKSSRT
jgi:hypothetical protein